MRTTRKLATAITVLAASAVVNGACSSGGDSGGESRACDPGDVKACACGGGVEGSQACTEDGSSWGACEGCPGGAAGSSSAAAGNGGQQNSGGVTATGGTIGSGGAIGTGGTSSTGGTLSTGGVGGSGTGGSIGGAPATGGAVGVGGEPVAADPDAGGGGATGSACGECTGCCDGTTCIEASAVDEARCGPAGESCRACQVGEFCFFGGCLSDGGSCSPGSCPTGCCSEGYCVLPGQMSHEACGSGGSACSSCEWGVTCAGGGVCTSEIAPSQSFYIRVVSVEVNPDAWDPFGGLPDIFVCFSDGVAVGCTSAGSDSSTASWGSGETLTDSSGNAVLFASDAILAGELRFTVWDADPTSSNEAIQSGVYSTGIATKEMDYFVTSLGSIIELHWRLSP